MPLFLGKSEEDDHLWSQVFVDMLLSGTIPPPFSACSQSQSTMTAVKHGDMLGEWLAESVLEAAEARVKDKEQYLSTVRAWAEQALELPDSVPDYFWQGLLKPKAYCYEDSPEEIDLNTWRIRKLLDIAPSAEVHATFKRYAPEDYQRYGVPVPGHLVLKVAEAGFAAVQNEVILRAETDLRCRAEVTPFLVGKSFNSDYLLSYLAVRMLLDGLAPPLPLQYDKTGQDRVEKWTAGVVLEVEEVLQFPRFNGEAYLSALQLWVEEGVKHGTVNNAFWQGLLTPANRQVGETRLLTIRPLVPCNPKAK